MIVLKDILLGTGYQGVVSKKLEKRLKLRKNSDYMKKCVLFEESVISHIAVNF